MLPPGLMGGPPPPGPGPPGGQPPGAPQGPGGGRAAPALVDAIIAKMHGGPGGPPGPPPGAAGPADDRPNGHGMSPLDGVQSVIQDLHDLMKLLPDPQAVNIAATCLKAMTGLQHSLMQTQGPGGGP